MCIPHFFDSAAMTKIERITETAILKVIAFFYKPFRKLVPEPFFRYGFAGATNMVFDWILYILFYNFVFKKEVFDLGFIAFTPHIAAFILKFPIIFLTGFWLNRHISFSGSPLRGRIQLFRYFLVVGACIVINYVCLKLFVEALYIQPELANIITTIIATFFSYFSQKHFSFKK